MRGCEAHPIFTDIQGIEPHPLLAWQLISVALREVMCVDLNGSPCWIGRVYLVTGKSNAESNGIKGMKSLTD